MTTNGHNCAIPNRKAPIDNSSRQCYDGFATESHAHLRNCENLKNCYNRFVAVAASCGLVTDCVDGRGSVAETRLYRRVTESELAAFFCWGACNQKSKDPTALGKGYQSGRLW